VLPPLVRAALEHAARRVRGRFGDRVREIRLFGSWARNEATADSDIDVVVVVDGLTLDEWHDAIDDIAAVELEHDVVIGPLVLSTKHFDELHRRGRTIARAIATEGVPL
jgi:predicted nucleotidyltransferase